MGIRHLVPLALAGFAAAACARTATESDRTLDAGSAMAASHMASDHDGKAVFDAVCATCHSVDAPANLAPPMSHVARHYRAELDGDEKAGLTRIMEWIRGPAAERSLLPDHAIERWGLMPPQALSDEQLEAVAGYVWSLGPGMNMGGMGQGQGGMGQGMMMGRGHGGMGQDTARHHGRGGMGQGQSGMGQGMMMGRGHGGMGQDTARHQGRGGMGQGQGGMGRGMMLRSGRGGPGGNGMMGRMCPMRTDTSSTPTR